MSEARFGIGVLTPNMIPEAEPGELITDRDTGMVGVISPTTLNFVSYDFMTRFKQVYDSFKSKMIGKGNIGSIGKIDIDENSPVIKLPNATELFPKVTVAEDVQLDFITFNLDIEVINKINMIPLKDKEAIVSITFATASNTSTNTSRTFTLNDTLSNINNIVTKPSYVSFETVSASINHKLSFDSIKVTLPDGLNPADYTIILHSILVCHKAVN